MVHNVNAGIDFSNQRLGNYRLVRLLGHGGFASVYLGEHLYLKRLAAIKMLRTVLTEKDKRRFLEEARLLANLSHPHIVRVLEFAIAQRSLNIQSSTIKENIPFLVMDYAPGGNLRTLYPSGTRLNLNIVVSHIKQAATALQYAHDQNIIHRDIKPENLLMNERQEVMLSDFGLALFAPSPELISIQGMAGTLHYAAPEQLQGKPGFASDQYSLSIIAYEWLCGSRPFSGDDVELIMHQTSSFPPPLRSKNPSIPRAVEDVILQALTKDPQQRYPTIQAFADALERATQERDRRYATAQMPAVRTAPARREFPAFHYFVQKSASIQPSQPISLPPAPATREENQRMARISSSLQRNRLRMIQKVRAAWVYGVLKQSLMGASFINLGLDERQDAVDNPWSSALPQSEKQARSLASDTTIIDIYDQSGGELLILGEAGSGKTTLLLELTRQLLNRAERDESAPLPVVFLLSSWAEKQLPLDEWLIEELNSKYQVPRPLGELWVRNEMLLPLLDGLDEVAANARSACVVAINTYKKEHGLNSLVVCSRLTEYLLYPPRVLLHNAVVVRPLTMQQIEGYLRSAGEKFELVYQILNGDLMLQRLVTTPLMLNIIMLAYQDKSPEDLLRIYSPKGRYQRILSTYVEQMLHRHPTTLADPQQLTAWLTYLARELQQHGQRVFYIEYLQPDWIENNLWRQFYRFFAVMLPGAVIGALVGILANVLFFHAGSIGSIYIDAVYGIVLGYLFSGKGANLSSPTARFASPENPRKSFHMGDHLKAVGFVGLVTFICMGLAKGWPAGLANALFLGILAFPLSIIATTNRDAASQFRATQDWYTKDWRRFFFKFLRNGTLAGIACGLTSIITLIVNHDPTARSLVFLASLGIRDSLRNALLGTLLGLLLINNDGFIHRAEIFSWSWKRFWGSFKGFKNIFYDLLIGIVVGLIFATKQLFQGNMDTTLSAGLSTGVLVAIAIRLIYAVLRAGSNSNLPDQRRSRPNEGIMRSLQHGLAGGVINLFIATFFSIMTTVVASVSADGLVILQKSSKLLASVNLGLSNALLLAPCGALLAFLLFGGLAYLQFGFLHFILQRTRALPQKLSRFLDYAADSVLLHRVGGGYIFIHRLLHEYFASLDEKDQSHEEPSSSAVEPLVRIPQRVS